MLVKTVALCSKVFYDKHFTKNGQDVVPSMSPLHKRIIMDIFYKYYLTIRNLQCRIQDLILGGVNFVNGGMIR